MDKTPEQLHKWKTLSLTHVEYLEEDKLGMIFAIYSLFPLVLVVVMATAFYFRRDLHTFTLGLGIIANYAFNYGLKKYFNEPRPKIRNVVFEEAGMPSTHSQFMWFFCVYMVLFIRFRLNYTGEVLFKVGASLVLLLLASLMSYSRVYLEYHTISQVVWGSVIGSVTALLWFLVTQFVFSPLYPVVASWSLAEAFLIRDCTAIPNIMWFEYVTSRGEANSRKKKERNKNM